MPKPCHASEGSVCYGVSTDTLEDLPCLLECEWHLHQKLFHWISTHPNDVFSMYENSGKVLILFCLLPLCEVRLTPRVSLWLHFSVKYQELLVVGVSRLHEQVVWASSMSSGGEALPETELLWQEKARRTDLNISCQRWQLSRLRLLRIFLFFSGFLPVCLWWLCLMVGGLCGFFFCWLVV